MYILYVVKSSRSCCCLYCWNRHSEDLLRPVKSISPCISTSLSGLSSKCPSNLCTVHKVLLLSVNFERCSKFFRKERERLNDSKTSAVFSYADMCSATFIYCHSLSLLQITSSPVTLIIAFRFTCQAGCPNVVNYTM